MQEYIKKIEQWAADRNIDEQGTVEAQAIKTAEEMAELIIGISKDNIDMIKDAIGDVFVTLVIGNMLGEQYDVEEMVESEIVYDLVKKSYMIARIGTVLINIEQGYYKYVPIYGAVVLLRDIAIYYGLTLRECVEHAYNEIKDRKGKMINGQFVKESEL